MTVKPGLKKAFDDGSVLVWAIIFCEWVPIKCISSVGKNVGFNEFLGSAQRIMSGRGKSRLLTIR
jgi:hypothetical protein